MLRLLTAGESHGRGIVAILDGMPAGLKIDTALVNQELKRRQSGFGRGGRMKIESDRAQILSGLKNSRTLGSPLAVLIENKDFRIDKMAKGMCPRPGHADLSGLLKYGLSDVREVLERASARSTAATVGVGALCKILLKEFGIGIMSRVLSIGGENSRVGMVE
ncbi:MAG: chorismate synthase, partial [Candidatus Omnitrophica bacterium]|nr:chorismate synthase [Candidatus Omnitrophota bacterium]